MVCAIDPTALMTWTRDKLGDEELARAIASNLFGVMSVTNHLRTDAEVREAREKTF